jgi:KTSC domain
MAHTFKEYIGLGREILARPLTWLVLVIAGLLLLVAVEPRGTPPVQMEESTPRQAEWRWLYSSNLVQSHHDKDSQELAIIFHGNRMYRFKGVPPDVAHGLETAGSAGHYFNTKIRGHYPFSGSGELPSAVAEMTCEEGVIDNLESAIKAYDEATYKAKREAGEKLATAARAVSEGCTETDQINDLNDPP